MTKKSLFLGLTICFVLILGSLGCQRRPEYPSCRTDSDCVITQGGAEKPAVCVFGKCQECGTDSDCPHGSLCRDNLCDLSCGVDNDCEVGCYCGGSYCRPSCISDDQCPLGESCVDGRCSLSHDPAKEACKEVKRVFFDFDRSNLDTGAPAVLDMVVKCAQDYPSMTVRIDGNTDSRGTAEYNLSLGDRRARAVSTYLSRMGVSDGRIRTVSYGEERPLDPRENKEAWAKNRRADVVMHD